MKIFYLTGIENKTQKNHKQKSQGHYKNMKYFPRDIDISTGELLIPEKMQGPKH